MSLQFPRQGWGPRAPILHFSLSLLSLLRAAFSPPALTMLMVIAIAALRLRHLGRLLNLDLQVPRCVQSRVEFCPTSAYVTGSCECGSLCFLSVGQSRIVTQETLPIPVEMMGEFCTFRKGKASSRTSRTIHVQAVLKSLHSFNRHRAPDAVKRPSVEAKLSKEQLLSDQSFRGSLHVSYSLASFWMKRNLSLSPSTRSLNTS